MHMPHTQQWCRGSTPPLKKCARAHNGSNCQMLSDPPYGRNKRRQPKQGGRAGGRVQQKTRRQINPRHWQPGKAANSRVAKSKTVHVLVRVCGTRWPNAQPTPARPEHDAQLLAELGPCPPIGEPVCCVQQDKALAP